MISPALYSSDRMDWGTPLEFFFRLDQEFHFTLDAAATENNRLCEEWIGPGSPIGEDAFSVRWVASMSVGPIWLNPPYGRGVGRWLEKAHYEAKEGGTVVMLLPARTCTRWWHDWAMRAHEIRFVKGRFKFGGQESPAPFPSVVLVFRPGCAHPVVSTMAAK